MIVSNSEVETYQRCQRKHWFAYGLGLTPTEKFMPLKCGIMGHEVLEAYYKAKKAYCSHGDCIQAGMSVIASYMTGDQDSEVVPIVTKRFLEYAQFYEHESFRVLDVEGVYSVPLPSGVEYALTLDLLVECTDGPWKGQQVVIDHKWTSNFWTLDEVFLMAQLPKYIHSIRKLGSTAKIGLVNQIRYRELKDGYDNDQIFRRSLYEPTQRRMDNIMEVQEQVAFEIAVTKSDPVKWRRNAKPSISRWNCKDCFFKIPCSIELDGRDPQPTLDSCYTSNTYGYSESKVRRNLE